VARPRLYPAPFARRRFGQHFLEPQWVGKVVDAIGPRPTDVVIEIGPGRGALTRPLAAAVAHVLAIEIDRDLAAALKRAVPANVTVITGDVLDLRVEALRAHLAALPLSSGRLRAAGNLPYNAASPILFRLLDFAGAGLPLADATVMLQREVADRLLATPGTRQYGVLSVLVGHRAAVSRRLDLPPGAFRPPPRVRSTVVGLRFHPPDPPVGRADVLEALTRALFTRRRKTLANALDAYLRTLEAEAGFDPRDLLTRAAIDSRRRPETLTLAEIARLAETVPRRADR
jgi:16S rRNA (adenine1518-N6/adenine1519-N6)-dimethyltransferase